MSDLIDRQAAIEILHEALDAADQIADVPFGVYQNYRDKMNELPPAQPKRGRWILDRSGAYCCSECMEPCAGYVMMKPRDKYCKMCGSRNEVTE